MEVDPSEWQKLCFTPTKSDANVVASRKWLNKFAGGKVNWGNKYDGSLSPSPPREQLMNMYWTHVDLIKAVVLHTKA
nr:protochlorophyllide-dependent translocon component 52, chloroplastic-like [Tanacetum cinerariifolium]